MKSYIVILAMLCNYCLAQQTIDTAFISKGVIKSITYKTNDEKNKVINYRDGNISGEINFKDGVRDGLSITYYPNNTGKIYVKEYYKEGRKTGLYETYSDTGKVSISGYYENGFQSGTWIYYDNKGNKQSVFNYSNGKLEGKEERYFENGKLQSETFYKDGKRDGPATLYYENGNKKYEGAYKDDKMFGQRLCYNKNGKLGNGSFATYTEDGLIERECTCIDGKPQGELKLYNNGKLIQIVNFRDGKPNGITTYFNAKKKELYKNGVFVKELKEEKK